jgi:hypothetical protein
MLSAPVDWDLGAEGSSSKGEARTDEVANRTGPESLEASLNEEEAREKEKEEEKVGMAPAEVPMVKK